VAVRRPRNRLGAATFGVVVAGALMTIFPRTAVLGFLLCLLAVVPAIFAYLRLRSGYATNRRTALGALIGAPTFLMIAFGGARRDRAGAGRDEWGRLIADDGRCRRGSGFGFVGGAHR